MPRKTNQERKIGNYTHIQIETALQLIRDGLSIRKAAKETGIAFTTIQRYRKKQQAAEPNVELRLVPNYTVNKVFSEQQEDLIFHSWMCVDFFYLFDLFT